MSHYTKIVPPSAFHTQSDETPQCPHCYNQGNSRMIGMVELEVQGENDFKSKLVKQPAYHCKSCNKLYSDVPNSIKAMAEHMKNTTHKPVGFTPVSNEGSNSSASSYNSNNVSLIGSVNTTPNYAEQQMASDTSQMKNDIQQMRYELQSMTSQLIQIAQKNNELMEKLSKDPLAGVRKSILEFNLQ